LLFLKSKALLSKVAGEIADWKRIARMHGLTFGEHCVELEKN
jgi:hypothetical protein